MDALVPQPKRRHVPPKIREAIFLLGQKRTKTLAETARRVGITRERLSRALREPHIAAYAQQKAAGTIAIAALRAASREVELLDARSEHVSHEASKFVLGVAGIKPASETNVNLNLEIRAGYVIDLGSPEKPMKIIGGADTPALLESMAEDAKKEEAPTG